jgi:hypothetical protein
MQPNAWANFDKPETHNHIQTTRHLVDVCPCDSYSVDIYLCDSHAATIFAGRLSGVGVHCGRAITRKFVNKKLIEFKSKKPTKNDIFIFDSH